jgi:hypothetical protein
MASELSPELLTAWQRGKCDVVCSACGRAEAANYRCSNCGRTHDASEYRLHRPGAKDHGAGSCALHGAVYPEARNAGWGDGFDATGRRLQPDNPLSERARKANVAKRARRGATEAVRTCAAVSLMSLGLV